jgi:DNA repair ATPase RecN
MADLLSTGASVLTVVTAAIQTSTSLYETVQRYKGRDKTLQRLQDELGDLANILQSLHEVVDADATVLCLLQRPIDRCGEVCREFEQTMKAFGGKSKMAFKDWAKMEFMSGDINSFIDAIAGYKSTIAVGLGTITM